MLESGKVKADGDLDALRTLLDDFDPRFTLALPNELPEGEEW